MGHVLFSVRDFYDSTSELVGIKSGILLNRFDISRFLLEKYDDEFISKNDIDSFIRLDSGTITDMVIHLRRRIGNLPVKSTLVNDYQILMDYTKKDFSMLGIVSAAIYTIEKNPSLKKEELCTLLQKEENIDRILANACINIAYEKLDTSIILNGGTNWDGITPLSKLFNAEVKPENDSLFIEQKFIDYLATNGNQIENIHWRNFERFCAEFFKREGYIVQLGKGTKDGGVDIRVFKPENLSTPFILIQCKRYNENHHVTIETVKSFYTDVLFEGAHQGLIATSGYIAPGGKKVCTLRNYNVNFAEKNNISQWAKNMGTFK